MILLAALGTMTWTASMGAAQEEPPPRERPEFRFSEWIVGVSGRVRDKGHNGSGSWLDLDDDLGISGASPSPLVEFGVDIPAVGKFTLGYGAMHFKGDQPLPRDILYSDQNFAAGTVAQTELWLKTYSLDYQYPLWRTSWGPGDVVLSPLVGGRLFSGHAEFRTPAGQTDSQLHRPILVPGLDASVGIAPWAQVDVMVAGLAYSTTKAAATYLETSAELTAHPWRGLTLGLGYRFVRNVIESKQGSGNHNFDLDADFSGFILSIGYRF